MKFAELNLSVNSVAVVFKPYDRGAQGAFVYREGGTTLHETRLIVSTITNDASSDRYSIQLNTPRVCAASEACGVPVIKGTDLAKVELRFLADTPAVARLKQIDTVIAALLEFRTSVGDREKLYA